METDQKRTPSRTPIAAFCREIWLALKVVPGDVELYGRRLREVGFLPTTAGRRATSISFEQAALLLLAYLSASNADKAIRRIETYAGLTIDGREGAPTLLGTLTEWLTESAIDQERRKEIEGARLICERTFPIAYIEFADGTRHVFERPGSKGMDVSRPQLHIEVSIKGAVICQLSHYLNTKVETVWSGGRLVPKERKA